MRVFITGGTGFVGRAVALRLLREGHTVSIWTRRPDEAPAIVGGDVRIADARSGSEGMLTELEAADAVINLAGETIVSRWNARRKEKLRSSRVELTRSLVDTMGRCEKPPRVFLSASAIGYYGNTLEGRFDESSDPATDFLAQLCVDWEKEALVAREHGARVALYRIGIVLGDGGGALGQMLPVFRLGAGGRLGSGRQWMSWIHLDDLVEMLVAGVSDSSFEGPINAVSPTPVSNKEFTAELGRAVNRPALLPVPGFALRLIFGEGAKALLASQHVTPRKLKSLGFEFQHPTLAAALSASTHSDPSVTITRAESPPTHPYLAKRGARYVLTQKTVIHAPLEEVFPFFSEAVNLGALTPPEMEFRILTPSPIDMFTGTEIDYRISLGPAPMRWRTVIEAWEPASTAGETARFVDAQHRGPYRSWFHEHDFVADGDRTLMTDRVWYSPPFGFLGRITHALFIRSMLRGIFEYRATRIRLRFGAQEERRGLAA
ncbi:MAG: TIGR01777 family oxidoreductase [Myxococcota bacterium]